MYRRLTTLRSTLVVVVSAVLVASLAAEAPATSPKEDLLWEHLRVSIADVESQLSGIIGVAILDLTTGRELLVHPDEIFAQASSIKIAVLAELYHQDSQSLEGVHG